MLRVGHKMIRLVAQVGPPIVGVVFLLSAVGKAIDTRDTEAVFDYLTGWTGIDPYSATRVLIFTEILIGAALLVNAKPRLAKAITATALVSFGLWAVVLIVTDLDVGCGCGLKIPGVSPAAEPQITIAKNIILLLLLFSPLLATMTHAYSPEIEGEST